MLADGVEASVRSLAVARRGGDPGDGRRIIEERIGDGQFDECDLTLRDLERIREAFVGAAARACTTSGSRTRRTRSSSSNRGAPARRRRRRRLGLVTRPIYLGPWRIDVDGPRRGGRRRSPAAAPRAGRSRAALDAAGAPVAGLDRADPVRRRGAGRAQRDAHGQARPDRRPVVPAAAAEAFPRTRRHGRGPARPTTSAAAGRRPHLGDIVVSVERAIDQAEAGRGGQTGDVRWSAGRRAPPPGRPTARSTSAAGTTPSPTRRRRCARSSGVCSPRPTCH